MPDFHMMHILSISLYKQDIRSLGILHGPSMLADRPVLVSAEYQSNLIVSVLRKHLVIGQFSFSLFFIGHQSP